MDAPQHAQSVVLLRRQVEAGEEFILESAQAIVRPPQAEEDLLFERIKAAARPNLSGLHDSHDVRHDSQPDNSCPDNYLSRANLNTRSHALRVDAGFDVLRRENK
jgi:hypothetical protein